MGVAGKTESYQYIQMIDEETECVFDFETNGIKKGFRLPHQLAVVDINSDKIEVINNRIPSYELPNPTALKATTTEWSKLLKGPSLYEKIFQIRESIIQYDIIWAYNAKYDDEVLQEALVACGLPPFPHRTDDKTICDALAFISLAGKLYPEIIKTPEENQKLETVFNNNFKKDSSIRWHEADGDVEATKKLLLKIRDNIPDLWKQRRQMFSKFARYSLFSNKTKYFYYKHGSKTLSEMLPIREMDRDNYYTINLNTFYQNGGLTKRNLTTLKQGKKPKWLETPWLKTKYIMFNPEWFNIKGNYSNPSDEDLQTIISLIEENLPLEKKWDKKEDEFLEEQIFGFPPNIDRESWDLFHKSMTWEEKISIKFSEKNSKRWALRIIFDNCPELLDTSHYKRMLNHIKDRWLSNDPETPYITIPKALNEMDELGEKLELKLFNGYRDYLKDMKENL